jgi:hypothetical protein
MVGQLRWHVIDRPDVCVSQSNTWRVEVQRSTPAGANANGSHIHFRFHIMVCHVDIHAFEPIPQVGVVTLTIQHVCLAGWWR